MSELKEVQRKIEEMKKYLSRIIELKPSLVDPDVIAVSKMLDTVLNQYNEMVKSEQDNRYYHHLKD